MAITKYNPQIPVENQSSLYLNGMVLHYNSATTFLVMNGACRSSDNTNDIIVTTGTNTIVGDDQYDLYTEVDVTKIGVLNGIQAASPAGGTYHVYAIAASSAIPSNQAQIDQYYSFATGTTVQTRVPDNSTPLPAGFYLSADNPVSGLELPPGYDLYRRIGSVFMSAANTIAGFRQQGTGVERTMYFAAPVSFPSGAGVNISATLNSYVDVDANGWIHWVSPPGNPVFTTFNLYSIIPYTAELAYVTVVMDNPAAAGVYLATRQPSGTDDVNGAYQITTAGSTAVQVRQIPALIDLSADNDPIPTIAVAIVSASGSYTLRLAGYVDSL